MHCSFCYLNSFFFFRFNQNFQLKKNIVDLNDERQFYPGDIFL